MVQKWNLAVCALNLVQDHDTPLGRGQQWCGTLSNKVVKSYGMKQEWGQQTDTSIPLSLKLQRYNHDAASYILHTDHNQITYQAQYFTHSLHTS